MYYSVMTIVNFTEELGGVLIWGWGQYRER